MASKPDSSAGSAPEETAIHLYAEHLLNIHALTLTATLSTHSTALTRAVLSADGSSLTITHEDASATIVLPTTIAGGGDAVLELPQERAKELQLRLRLEEKQKGFLEAPFEAFEEGNWVPWNAYELQGRAGLIQCAGCGRQLAGLGKKSKSDESKCTGVEEWRDLPNENWAEMMDFWHCHKPTPVYGTNQEVGGAKGYAAGNKLHATENVGFVDLESFLLSKKDCQGMKTAADPSNPSTPPLLQCESCNATVGAVDESADGWRLWKRAIKITFEPESVNQDEDEPREQQYPVQKWIAARFLALIDNQGVRKFEVRDADAEPDAPRLFIWIFTPDLTFSSCSHPPPKLLTAPTPTSTSSTSPTTSSIEPATASNSSSSPKTTTPNPYNRPTRAMKALWKTIVPEASSSSTSTTPSLPLQGSALNASVEEVAFPGQTFRQLKDALEQSSLLLPRTAREFQGWRVGLLQRFDREDMRGKGRGKGEKSEKGGVDGKGEGNGEKVDWRKALLE